MLRLLFVFLAGTWSVLAHPALFWSARLEAQIQERPLMEEIVSTTEGIASLVQEAPHVENVVSQPERAPITQLYQFKDGTSLENLAARPNGNLILTAISDPSAYLLDPTRRNSKPQLIHRFPEATSLTGIVETSPDVFAVVAGNWSTKTFEGVPNSFEVWSIDFNTRQPTIKSIAKMPKAAALNGITNCHKSETVVLIADSEVGAIWKLDTSTGEHSIAFRDPLFTNCTSPFPLGLNGVAMFDEKLHFANSALRIYGRVPILEDGTASGEIEILGRALPAVTAFDDVVLDWEGNGWIATHPNAVTEITPEGKQRNFTGTDVEMLNPTSIVWGRGSLEQEKILYLTTNGMSSSQGKFFGAQVISLDTRLI